MPSTPTTNGTAVLKFGITETEYGIAEDVVITEEAEKQEVEDGAGEVVGTIHFKKRTKVTATYTPVTGSTAPAVGAKVTLGGVSNVILDSVEKKGKKAGVQTWAIAGYAYPSLTSGT